MRFILSILIIFTSFYARKHSPTVILPKTYYFSISGSDGNSSTDAQDSTKGWKTIAKLNSFFSSLSAGDTVKFHRGDVWSGSNSGTIIINKSGITISAWGTGAKPVISGLLDLTFSSHSGNIWTSVESINTDPLNVVTLNGAVIGMGRYPQTGWLKVDSRTSGSTPILTSTHNSTGASGGLISQPSWNLTTTQAIIRLRMWVNAKYAVTAKGTNTITVDATHESDDILVGWGFFIQDDPATLTYPTAWYLDRSTNKLKYYHSSSSVAPTGLQVGNISSLIKCNGFSDITIDNLSLIGANDTCINISGGARVNVQNCTLNKQMSAITITATNSHYNNDSIMNTLNQAIAFTGSPGNCSTGSTGNDTANFNYIYNTDVIPGTDGYVGNVLDNQGCAILMKVNNVIAEHNIIRNVALNGFNVFRNSNITIRYNWVDSFNLIKSDLGAIYFVSNDACTNTVNRKIIHNIVSNGFGPRLGTDKTKGNDMGIYMDNGALNVTIDSNSVSNCTIGIFVHSSSGILIRQNTVFATDTAIQINHESSSNRRPENCIVTGNIAFVNGSETNQHTLMVSDYAVQSDIDLIGTIDNNFYIRTIGTPNDAIYDYNHGSGSGTKTQLPTWRANHTFAAYDVHTDTLKYKYVSQADQNNNVLYKTNPSSSPITITFPGLSYKDVHNSSFTNSVSIPAWSSILLFKVATINHPPVITMGPNQIDTLPTNSNTLVASATDADGNPLTYLWTQISGPSTATISSPTSPTTNVSGLILGTYTFRLTVDDGHIGVTSADVSVAVTAGAPPNFPPNITMGLDQIDTLPTNSNIVAATVTDPEGDPVTLLWTQTSGPNTGVIHTPTATSTSITGLIFGTYVFKLTATDNHSNTTNKSISIFVINPPPVTPHKIKLRSRLKHPF